MSTTFEIPQLPIPAQSIARTRSSLDKPKESHQELDFQKLHSNILGIMGLVVTLTVFSSGIYVFFHYLL